jgi:hypothetical protein
MSDIEILNDRIQSLLSMRIDDETSYYCYLDNLVKDFGIDEVQRFHLPRSRHNNLLIHEFVRLGLLKQLNMQLVN